ncbi:MAG: S41 family peptidase [Chthoniobacterales bacterium]
MLRHVLSASLTILLAASVAAQSPSPAPAAATPSPARSILDSLNAADLEQAIPIIKANYVDPAALNETELNRAVLAGLLSRLGNGVMLLPAHGPAATPAPAPLYREIIAGHIGYLRPSDLNRDQLAEMDLMLRGLAGKKVDALIIDLRASGETNDYGMAAEFASRFVPKGKPLFTLRGPGRKELRAFLSSQDPIYHGLVVVLVDADTAGTAEALAAALRLNKKAIVIGEATAGRAVNYADRPLPSGNILRIAVAQAVLPDQQPLFPNGLKPDLSVAQPLAEKRQIFEQSLTKGMSPFVFESDRPHLNEAALLAGTNPEIEAAQTAQQRRARGGDAPALHDPVLQRAVDVVTSIGVYEKQPGGSP